MKRGRGAPRASVLAVIGAVFLALLLTQTIIALAVSAVPLVSVRIAATLPGNAALETEFVIETGLASTDMHVALVPGTSAGLSSTTLFFADPSYPALYSSYGTIIGTAARLGSYVTLLHLPTQVALVNGADLPAALAAHPGGYLVMLGTGVVPDSVFSPNATALADWVAAGGTLVWAGGPLGYYAGHPVPSGFQYDNPGWSGQVRFLGFPLTDPTRSEPLPSPTAAPVPPVFTTGIQAALGVTYNSTGYGANLTELTAHQGLPLGWQAPPVGGAAARTSLAWVPVGNGSVYFFGGAEFPPQGGFVPAASILLSEDIGLLLALHYHPSPGPSAYSDIAQPPLAASTARFQVGPVTHGEVAFARSDVGGSLLYFTSAQVA